MNFRSSLAWSCAVVALSVSAFAQQPTPFAQATLSNFDAWDTNHDGALQVKEIDRAALDPSYHGEAAAALAALHSWLSATKDAPTLTKSWFQTYQPTKRPKADPPLSQSEARAARKAREASPGGLEQTYSAALKRIKAANSFLFAETGPDIDDIKQGALGDCFFLAPLGAVVHRDPEAIRHMIQPQGNGYVFRFGDGTETKIAAPTDAEIGMGGSSMKSGLWVRIAEKAFGSRSISAEDQDDLIARDNNRGGNSGRAGLALTGHKFKPFRLIGDYQKQVPDTTVEPLLTQLRTLLPKALADHRLVLAGTAKQGTPKSITPNHAYAIFGFDKATDRITLWNPHGDNFALKGPEGFENGFARTNGEFSMPLKDFVHAFSRASFEQP